MALKHCLQLVDLFANFRRRTCWVPQEFTDMLDQVTDAHLTASQMVYLGIAAWVH